VSKRVLHLRNAKKMLYMDEKTTVRRNKKREERKVKRKNEGTVLLL